MREIDLKKMWPLQVHRGQQVHIVQVRKMHRKRRVSDIHDLYKENLKFSVIGV